MGYSPEGEWQKWQNASFFGAVSLSENDEILLRCGE
jgi:hypothetical protein